MEAERWERIQDLFHRAVTLDAEARESLLSTECEGDPETLAGVQRLLLGDATPDSPLDRDVAAVAHAIMHESGNGVPADAFGPYRLTRLLGEGGMGVVYLAERTDLQSRAAIKILRDAWLSPARRERFLGEQRTLAQLSHPRIARLFDAGTLADGTPWIAMEYVEGVSIVEYCRHHRAPVRERLRLARDVCDAVLHAHQHLVIHRDLKPANVLVTRDGGVKLLDFGIARQLESLDAVPDATRTGLRLMTPAYAAPEQVLGKGIGIHTDVYSLGVMLYELLTGQLPFDLSDMTPGQAETTIIGQEPARPSARAAAATATGSPVVASRAEWADLDVLCRTAMHKDPARRYRTVDALARDIDHYLAGEPLDARPDALGYRTGKFLRRNRRSIAAATAVVLLVVSLVGFYTTRLRHARDAAVAETARTQNIQRFMTGLFQGGDEAAGPAESLRVVSLLDAGVAQARALDREPAVQADLFQTLSVVYHKLGQLDRADSLLQVALARRRSLPDGSGGDLSRSLVALAELRTSQGRYDDAERLAREGLAVGRAALPAGDPWIAEAMTSLGKALEERGEHESAIVILDSAVTRLSSGGRETPELIASLHELANAHFYAGRLARSDSLNLLVLGMTRRLYGERHPNVADDLLNLGAAQQERGNYADAERYAREGAEINRAWYGPDHIRVAANLTHLGRALVFQRKFAEAEPVLAQALAIQERTLGPDHPRVASTLNEVGNAASMQGDLPAAAKARLRVLEIWRVAYPGRNFRLGVGMGNLAATYMDMGDHRRSEPLFRQALQMFEETQGPEHTNTAIGHIRLGRCLLRQGRFRDAERETLRGYEVMSKIAAPGISFLQAARQDLSTAYDSLGRPDQAARFRAEHAANTTK